MYVLHLDLKLIKKIVLISFWDFFLKITLSITFNKLSDFKLEY